MKFPFIFAFATVLLATFVLMMLACAVAAELQVWAKGKAGRRR